MLRKFVKVPIEYVEWLREKKLGEFEGTPEGTFVKYVDEHKLDLMSFRPKDGESIIEFRERVRMGFENLIKTSKYKTILLITHGGVIVQLLLHILKIDDKEYKKLHPQNCAITILEIKGAERKAHLINCVGELKN